MDTSKIRVLILKAPPEEGEEHDPYVHILTRNGFSAIMIPTLEFRFKNLDVFCEHLKQPRQFSGLIVSSPRCAAAVIRSFKAISDEILVSQWKESKCFVVGDATARILNKSLMFSCEGKDSGNLSNLLAFVAENSFEKPFLMPIGNLHKNQESCLKVEKIEVYETTEHAHLEENLCSNLANDNNLLLISFFSPSGVKSALPYVKQYPTKVMKFIAIGPTTAQELENCCLEISGVCKKPSPESLLETIQKIVGKL